MSLTTGQIAEQIGGALEGDAGILIERLAGLSDAGPGDITFLSNPKYASMVPGTLASAIIVGSDWQGNALCALIRVANPDKSFALIAGVLGPKPPSAPPGIHSTAIVAADVGLGADVSIGPYCVLEPGVNVGAGTVLCAGCYVGHGVRIGADCKFYPHVSIREGAVIGNRVLIHNGAVIGSDGFGYTNDRGKWVKIPQIGTVEIGDDVEIGANTTIDRARFGKTVIGNGVKIDNLVQIAHNVRIGDNTAMAALSGVAGSTTIGRNVQIGGQAGITGHISLADNCIIAGGAVVTKDTRPGTFLSGYPAMPHDKAKKMHAGVMLLPHLKERVLELEKKVRELEEKKI